MSGKLRSKDRYSVKFRFIKSNELALTAPFSSYYCNNLCVLNQFLFFSSTILHTVLIVHAVILTEVYIFPAFFKTAVWKSDVCIR